MQFRGSKDVETIKELYDFRKGFMLNDVHSLLNPDVLNVEYVQDEYTPVVVNNVFTEQASKMIREYYHNSIDNDKFQFGDIFLYFKGSVFIKVENLLISPYFSFIGNLGNSHKSFVSSITPEC